MYMGLFTAPEFNQWPTLSGLMICGTEAPAPGSVWLLQSCQRLSQCWNPSNDRGLKCPIHTGFLVVHHPEIQGNCLGAVLWRVPLDARLQSLRCDSWTFPQLTHCDQATSGREFTIRFLSLWLSSQTGRIVACSKQISQMFTSYFRYLSGILSILSSASQKLWSDVSRQKQNGAVIIPDHRHRGLVFGGLHSPWVWCHRHQTIGLSMAYRL